jgi:predicted dienelactone hydrolase
VLPHEVAAVDANLAAKHEYRVVSNSGHFAFLPPCPAELAKAAPEACTDAPGFDRAAFHREFNAAVTEFFQEHLVKAANQ